MGPTTNRLTPSSWMTTAARSTSSKASSSGWTQLLPIHSCKYLFMELGGNRVVLASIPLQDCIGFPGIKDGTLFQKNVRQSLGLNNTVNKGIKTTIYGNSRDFFFYHNGITAI